jgi:hypothetical protein
MCNADQYPGHPIDHRCAIHCSRRVLDHLYYAVDCVERFVDDRRHAHDHNKHTHTRRHSNHDFITNGGDVSLCHDLRAYLCYGNNFGSHDDSA